MGRKVAKVDTLIAKIAARQRDVVSVWQLYELGIGERGVRCRVDAGRLHRLHRGVYAVGHSAPSTEARWLAAVLAVGGNREGRGGAVLDYWGATLSHRTAACFWGLLSWARGPVDVSVRGDGGRARRAGICVHRTLTLARNEVTLHSGIPVTTPSRTIADLRRATQVGRSGISPPLLRKAIRQANVLGLPVGDEDPDRTRSDLEKDFLQICSQHRLPAPEVNVRIGPYLVDFLWREGRLIVETDCYLYHRGKVAFQDDRERDLELRRLGYDVLRLSERQINEEPGRLAETLNANLGGDT